MVTASELSLTRKIHMKKTLVSLALLALTSTAYADYVTEVESGEPRTVSKGEPVRLVGTVGANEYGPMASKFDHSPKLAFRIGNGPGPKNGIGNGPKTSKADHSPKCSNRDGAGSQQTKSSEGQESGPLLAPVSGERHTDIQGIAQSGDLRAAGHNDC